MSSFTAQYDGVGIESFSAKNLAEARRYFNGRYTHHEYITILNDKTGREYPLNAKAYVKAHHDQSCES